MEVNLDELAHIGMGFTKPNPINRNTNKEEIQKLNKSLKDNTTKTEDEMISIIVNPDPDYENPDTTGNGVEHYSFSLEEYITGSVEYDSCKKEITKIITVCNNHVERIKKELIKINSGLTLKDKQVVNTIFNKVVQNLNSKISTNYLYNETGNKIMSLLDILSRLNISISEFKFEDFDSYILFFLNGDNIDYTWLFDERMRNYFNYKEYSTFFQALDNYSVYYITTQLESYCGLRSNKNEASLRDIISNPDNILGTWNKCNHDLIKYINPIKLTPSLKIYNIKYACIIIRFVYKLYMALFNVILNINEDIQNILERIEPSKTSVTPMLSRLIDNLESKDPWIVTDYHLLKELKHGTTDTDITDNIIKMHNSLIKPDDVVLFEGDISESEYFDLNKINYIKKISETVKRLHGRKIMIMGNNDSGPKELYLKMGFEEVYERPLLGNKYLFSHEPQIMTNYPGILNIHGHIHGSKTYYNMSPKNHLDSYYGIYGKPMRLSELVKYYNNGKYDNLESEPSDWKDPRTNVKPINIQGVK